MRIDKFLWCVRLCKTRSVAAEECKKGHVRLKGNEAKASAEVQVGNTVSIRQPPIWRVFEVNAIPPSRVGAKLVPEFVTDRTPWEALEKQEIARKVQVASRDSGAGRPTKRDRRDISRFSSED